jgi:hypothetical protein
MLVARTTMPRHDSILVLGAYGLAGRAIVDGLIQKTRYPVVATGRDPGRLGRLAHARAETRVLDANDRAALGDACRDAAFVINAIGPYTRNGAAIARVVLESGAPYLDCANEQQHYHHLSRLDSPARSAGLPLITAAGAFPGISTLLAMRMLANPMIRRLNCCCAQFRGPNSESGLASLTGAILDALGEPVAVHRGERVGIRLGSSRKEFVLPLPFGSRRLLEVPLIDALTLPQWRALEEFHAWFLADDMPTGLLRVVRWLQPHRRPWAYRLMASTLRIIHQHATRRATLAGLGPECLVHVCGTDGRRMLRSSVTFLDGAVATACLPVHLANAYLRGEVSKTGLLTPIDLVDPHHVPALIAGACSRVAIDPDPDA